MKKKKKNRNANNVRTQQEYLTFFIQSKTYTQKSFFLKALYLWVKELNETGRTELWVEEGLEPAEELLAALHVGLTVLEVLLAEPIVKHY